MERSRWIRVVAVAALAMLLALTGCRASGRVVVTLARNGSGTVAVTLTLDAEAAARVGDLKTALSTGDLTAAGWTIGAPQRRGTGSSATTALTISKAFGSAAGLSSVMEELSGSSGLFARWKASVTDGFASTSWAVTGKVLATGDLAQFSDGRLAAALDGHPLGRTAAELKTEWGSSATMPLVIEVRVPDADPQLVSVDLASGSSQRRALLAESTDHAAGPTLWFLVAGLSVALGGIILVLARLRTRARPAARTRR